MTVEKRKELLLKPNWTYHDIADYVDCGTTKAIAIKNQAAREYGGSIRYMSQCVTVDSVMQCLGTTREKELEAIRQLENKEREG